MSNYRAKNKKGRAQRIKKIKKVQKRDSIIKSRLLWDSVLGVVFVLSFSYLVFFSGAFALRDVSITAPGTLGHIVFNVKKDVYQDLDKSFLRVLNKRSFFSARVRSIKANILDSYPEIAAITARRVFPNGLFIELYERKPVATWCYSELACFLIDENGIVFNTTNEIDKSFSLIYSENKTIPLDFELLDAPISKEKLSQIIALGNVFNSDLSVQINHFITDGNDMLHAVTEEGWSVYFVLSENMEMDITKLKLLFEKELDVEKTKNLEYIDLRFSKAYYK